MPGFFFISGEQLVQRTFTTCHTALCTLPVFSVRVTTNKEEPTCTTTVELTTEKVTGRRSTPREADKTHTVPYRRAHREATQRCNQAQVCESNIHI